MVLVEVGDTGYRHGAAIGRDPLRAQLAARPLAAIDAVPGHPEPQRGQGPCQGQPAPALADALVEVELGGALLPGARERIGQALAEPQVELLSREVGPGEPVSWPSQRGRALARSEGAAPKVEDEVSMISSPVGTSKETDSSCTDSAESR